MFLKLNVDTYFYLSMYKLSPILYLQDSYHYMDIMNAHTQENERF